METEGLDGFPPQLATDPVRVMRSTLHGIRRNQLHVFPDAIAQISQHLKRYTPQLLGWITAAFTRRFTHGTHQSRP
jgi:hypothetical protein